MASELTGGAWAAQTSTLLRPLAHEPPLVRVAATRPASFWRLWEETAKTSPFHSQRSTLRRGPSTGWHIMTDHHPSLQSRLAQGGDLAFYVRWIFEGERLLEHLQREVGGEPQDFCCFRAGLLQPA